MGIDGEVARFPYPSCFYKTMETTLIILKPDCMQKALAGTALDRLLRAGLSVVGGKMLRLTPALLREHYAHITARPFYPEVEAFMASAPVLVLALRGEGAIAKVRELLGPTDSRKAPKGTLRGDFGEDAMRNLLHASDGPEAAAVELARFFRADELF